MAAGAQAQAALDIARENLRSVLVGRGSLEAAVASAQAALQLAEIDLSNTRVLAPRDGQLGQVGVRLGAYVNAGTQVTAIVPAQLWVIANLKEAQMARVAVGRPATLTVDALNNATLRGPRRAATASPPAGGPRRFVSRAGRWLENRRAITRLHLLNNMRLLLWQKTLTQA